MKLINYIFSIFLILFFNNIHSKEINFLGLKKLNSNDLQTLSNIDLTKIIIPQEVNSIIQDLYKSDLISDINLEVLENSYSINVKEAKRIENIYINGNIIFKDDDIID